MSTKAKKLPSGIRKRIRKEKAKLKQIALINSQEAEKILSFIEGLKKQYEKNS